MIRLKDLLSEVSGTRKYGITRKGVPAELLPFKGGNGGGMSEAESIYNEPTDIKKRLGGRYGGEPEFAVADPGNKEPALSAKKESVNEARGQTLADLGSTAVGKTARVTVGFTHNGVSVGEQSRGKVMSAPTRVGGRLMVKIKFDRSTVPRNSMFSRTLSVPASHMALAEAVADAKANVTPEDSHDIEKDLKKDVNLTTNSPKMFETQDADEAHFSPTNFPTPSVEDINETEKGIAALGRLLDEKIRKLPFGMSVGKQSEYRTKDDAKIIRKFMFAGRSLRTNPRWTSAKTLERTLGSRAKVADWLKHTNLKVSRQSYKGEPGFQIQPVGKDYVKMMQHGKGIKEARGVDNPFDSHDMSWAKTRNPGSPKTPVGEVQKKLMTVLHGLGYGDHQLADLVRSPEFRNVHFKRIQTAASALKKKKLVNYDGSSKVSLVEAVDKPITSYKGWSIYTLGTYTTPYYYPQQRFIKGRKVGGPTENYPTIKRVEKLIDKWLKQMGKESLGEAESWGKNISTPSKLQAKKQVPKAVPEALGDFEDSDVQGVVNDKPLKLKDMLPEAKKVPTTEWFYAVIYIKRLRDKGKRNEAEYASAFLNWIGRGDRLGRAKNAPEPEAKGLSTGAAQSIKRDLEKIVKKKVHWIDPEEAERLMSKHRSPGEGPVVPKEPSRHGGESPINRLRHAKPSGWVYK